MFSWIWHTFFFDPIYNILVFLVNIMGGSLFAGIVSMTLLIKLILAPVYNNTLRVQIKQKELQPKIKEIREKYKDKEIQAQKIMELFRENKTSPFSGCLLFFIQIPVIFALYKVVLDGIEKNADLLYTFNTLPDSIYQTTFGINMMEPSIALAIATAILQFVQLKHSPSRIILNSKNTQKDTVQNNQNSSAEDATSNLENMTQNLNKTMDFFIPLMIFGFGVALPAGVMVYWLTNILFTAIQEKMFIIKYKADHDRRKHNTSD